MGCLTPGIRSIEATYPEQLAIQSIEVVVPFHHPIICWRVVYYGVIMKYWAYRAYQINRPCKSTTPLVPTPKDKCQYKASLNVFKSLISVAWDASDNCVKIKLFSITFKYFSYDRIQLITEHQQFHQRLF